MCGHLSMPTRDIVVLAFEGVQILDAAGPLEVFDEANRFSRRGQPYRVRCLAAGTGPVRASNGLPLALDSCTGYRGRIDTLVLPGGDPEGMARVLADARVMDWIRRRAGRARRVASVCTGALILAATGLLEGRRATTHWGAVDRLRAAAPTARIEPDALFTEDGRIHTSAGVTAGIDLALALVEADVGHTIAAAVARNLVLYLRRPGGQSQFSAPLQAQSRGRGRLAGVVDHILSSPEADLSVTALAERAAMSPRHFSRAFRQETGEAPARFVAGARLEAARMDLVSTSESVKRVAARCGFRSADVLARRFRERFGMSPMEYRGRFGARSRPA